MTVAFEKAAIKVEKEKEFAELQSAIERAFSGSAERFLKSLQSKGIHVRDLDAVIAKGLLERVDVSLGKQGRTAQGLYTALTVSDQAQVREFYLQRAEEVPPELRTKYQKVYRYY